MKLRRFNLHGISAFRQHLALLREQPSIQTPASLLEDPELTQIVSPEINIAEINFSTKHDAATYFSTVLARLQPEEVAMDAGLWTWLSLFYFDSVCPQTSGNRTPKNDYHYIFEPRNMRHFYRHLLFAAWHINRLAKPFTRLFLRSRISVLDSLTSETLKRLFITRIPCIFEVLDRLYWDEAKKRPRPGAVSSKPTPGNLSHRLPHRIAQLEKTYDLMSLNADQLLELLGPEFPVPPKLF